MSVCTDDYGNSCIRIFPFLKKSSEILDNAERDKELEELNCAIKFTKADISSFEFIAQIDSKFILVRTVMQNSGDEVLVLFDQHAVDERIRVEQLLKDYTEAGKWLGTAVNPPIQLNMPQTYSSMFIDFQSNFEECGLDYELKIVSKEKLVISFVKVPTCFYNRATREKNDFRSSLKQLVESLVKEMLQKFCAEGTLMHTWPNELLNVVNYEACRGAVKFGDKLKPQICTTLIEKLSTCDLPFQCAHGRPCLAPLVNLCKLKHLENKVWKPNMLNFGAMLCE